MITEHKTTARDHLPEMLALRAEGFSLKKIGECFGISFERVRQLIGSRGHVERRIKHKEVFDLYNSGKSPAEISKITGLSDVHIRNLVGHHKSQVSFHCFWRHVHKTDGCWLWTGSTNPKTGYGNSSYCGKREYAHRVSWIIHNGPIPKGKVIRHTCDNPVCVNPSHLLIGTQADNMRDRDERGRTHRGPHLHPHSKPYAHRTRNGRPIGRKLNAEEVAQIRRMYSRGIANQRELAKAFRVCRQCVSAIVNGKIWKNT